MRDDASSSNRSKIKKNLGFTFIQQSSVILLNFIILVIVARTLGPHGNGQYSLALLLPSLLALMLNFGIPVANVYFLNKKIYNIRDILLSNVLIFSLLSLLAVGLGAIVISSKADTLFPGVPAKYLWLALLSSPFILFHTSIVSMLQALQKFVIYNAALIAVPVTTVIVLVVMLYFYGAGVGGVILAQIIGYVGGLLVGGTYLIKNIPFRGEKIRIKQYLRNALGFGLKAHLSNILTFINYRADVFIVNYLLGPVQTGIYVIALQIGERLWVISQTTTAVLLPKLVELQEDKSRVDWITPILARIVFYLTLASILVAIIIARPFINIFFGAQYSNSYAALVWLLPGVLMGAFMRVLNNDIAAKGKPEYNLLVAFVLSLTNIVGNILLVPVYGIDGAAMAMTIGYLFGLIITLIYYASLSNNKIFTIISPSKQDINFIKHRILKNR